MDFEPAYTPEQEAFRDEVKGWLKSHVPQIEGDPDSDENYAQYRELGRQLGERGWLRATAAPEYGGGGLSVDEAIVLGEEIDRYDLTLPPYYDSGGRLGGASILVWGTEEQKQRLLPPISRGEIVTWQLLTGPEAGSDLAGTQTDAVRDGDEYIINGEKIFVGGSHGADQLWTITRTDRDGERHRNLSWFMIPFDTPGHHRTGHGTARRRRRGRGRQPQEHRLLRQRPCLRRTLDRRREQRLAGGCDAPRTRARLGRVAWGRTAGSGAPATARSSFAATAGRCSITRTQEPGWPISSSARRSRGCSACAISG